MATINNNAFCIIFTYSQISILHKINIVHFMNTNQFITSSHHIFKTQTTNNNPIAECFDGDAIKDILNQEGCVDIRFYFGLDTENKLCLVITGVDTNGNDLYSGLLAERGFQCPSYCSSSNPLNFI